MQVRHLVIAAYVANKPSPSLPELAEATGSAISSTAVAVDALVAAGELTRTPGAHRSLRPLLQPEPRAPRSRHQNRKLEGAAV